MKYHEKAAILGDKEDACLKILLKLRRKGTIGVADPKYKKAYDAWLNAHNASMELAGKPE